MASFKSKLIDRKEVAENTAAFYFEKPVRFEFKAGQDIDMTLINPPQMDEKGSNRTFSIASPPYAENLMFATRIRGSTFKKVLQETPLGTEVDIDGPHGSMTLHNDFSKPAVILTGGIGITPFRSIILQATKEGLPHKIYLFYSNRRPEDAPFLEDLQQAEKENPNFKLVLTMTQPEMSNINWSGETGYINQELISRYVNNLNIPIYYLAGPPKMVSDLHKLLNEIGINDDYIRFEEFSGY